MTRILMILLALAAVVIAQDDEAGSECEVCGAWVPMPKQSYISGNTKYVYLDKRKPRRYCNPCQYDINNGKIDPSNPPMLSPRDEAEELSGDNPYGNKWAVKELDTGKRTVEKDEEAESGFGAMKYVAMIVVAIGAALRFFLK